MARPSAPLPESASVVIIGGGVIGCSAAFHLAEAGVDVLLLERDQLGSGSTSRAAGGIRAQFSDPLNIQIAQRSLAAFREFSRRPGWEIDLKQVGYLFVLSRDADVAAFEDHVALQNEYGVPSRMLSAERTRELCPLLAGDDIVAGAFSPDDGHVTPEAVVQGYAFAARALGAQLRVGCEATGVRVAGGEVCEVVTSHGSVATGTVICAAGAWSRQCGAMAGVELPVTPLRRQVLFTEPIRELPAQLPFTIDFTTSFYFHREGPGLLMGMSDPDERPGFSLRDDRRLGPGAAGDRLPAGAADRRDRDQGWLGGPVRGQPGPQRDHRRSARAVAVHLCHRVLRSWVPAGTGGGGDRSRSGAGAPAVRGHRAAGRRALH